MSAQHLHINNEIEKRDQALSALRREVHNLSLKCSFFTTDSKSVSSQAHFEAVLYGMFVVILRVWVPQDPGLDRYARALGLSADKIRLPAQVGV